MATNDRRVLDMRDNPQQLMFSVKACKGAHIELLSDAMKAKTYYDVYIGGGANTHSAIRVNGPTGPTHGRKDSVELNCEVYKTFWMAWNTHSMGSNTIINIRVGRRHLGHDVFIEESFEESSTYHISNMAIWAFQAYSYWVISQGWSVIYLDILAVYSVS